MINNPAPGLFLGNRDSLLNYLLKLSLLSFLNNNDIKHTLHFSFFVLYINCTRLTLVLLYLALRRHLHHTVVVPLGQNRVFHNLQHHIQTANIPRF